MPTPQPDRPSTVDALVAPAAPPAERCVSCGVELSSPYCAQCGEKRASDRRFTLLHFGHEVFEHLTQLDGTGWRTLRTLVARPGELTVAYMRGERLRYMKPLQFFVLVSVVYFFVAGFVNVRTFDTPLRVQTQSYNAPARLVAQRIAERQTTRAEYAEKFDATSTAQAKSLVIVMVPVFALFVALVEIRKHRYALEHLVFALHVYTALLVLIMATDVVTVPLLRLAGRAGLASIASHAEGILSLILAILVVAYLVRALRRTYGDGHVAAVAKGFVLFAGMAALLFAYRVLLFYTTFWAT